MTPVKVGYSGMCLQSQLLQRQKGGLRLGARPDWATITFMNDILRYEVLNSQNSFTIKSQSLT